MEFERICELFREAGYRPRSYSGRYMYGEECLGVSCGDPSGCRDEALELCADRAEEKDFIAATKGYRTDSLGRGQILYFPNIKWEESDE